MDSLSYQLLSLFLAYATFARAETTTMSTSVVQATRQATHTYTEVPAASGGGYGSYGSNAVNTEGGASGTSASSFNLSQGAMIAIIVVVVTVAVFGSKTYTKSSTKRALLTVLIVASVVLFILAKRRQWNIRQSIKRASRRLTGRTNPPSSKQQAAKKKRSGIVAGTGSQSGTRAAYPPGEKRGVVVEVKDEEKGPLDYPAPPKTEKPKQNAFAGKLWSNNWK